MLFDSNSLEQMKQDRRENDGRLDAARVTAEWKTARRSEADLSDSPLFGGKRQTEMFGKTDDVRTVPTQEFISRVARMTTACQAHGDIVYCRPFEGTAIDSGYALLTRLYDVTFEDGHQARYWLRGGIPVRI